MMRSTYRNFLSPPLSPFWLLAITCYCCCSSWTPWAGTILMVQAQWTDQGSCSLDKMPLVVLAKNPETGDFVLLGEGPYHSEEWVGEGPFLLQEEEEEEEGNNNRNLLSLRGLSYHPKQIHRNLQVRDYFLEESPPSSTSWTTTITSFMKHFISVMTLSTNSETKTLQPGLSLISHSRRRRFLQSGDPVWNETQTSLNLADNSTLDDDQNDEKAVESAVDGYNSSWFHYHARECTCFVPLYPTIYCPLTVQTCNRPTVKNLHGVPGCLTSPPGRDRTKQLFQFVTIWFIILVCSILMTRKGKNLLDFMLGRCIPQYNEWIADRLLGGRHRGRAMELIERNIALRRRHRRVARVRQEWEANNSRNGGNRHGLLPEGQALATRLAGGGGGGGGGGAVLTPQQRPGPSQQQVSGRREPPKRPSSLTLRTTIYRVSMEDIKGEDPLVIEACPASPAATTRQSFVQTYSPQRFSLLNPRGGNSGGGASSSSIRNTTTGTIVAASAATNSLPPTDDANGSVVGGDGTAASTTVITATTAAAAAAADPTTHRGDETDFDALCCTICFTSLKDGDRVGALPCTHIFHVHCLKKWLQRRNVCPLCQTQEIATPHFAPPEATTTIEAVAGASASSGGGGDSESSTEDYSNNSTEPQDASVDGGGVDASDGSGGGTESSPEEHSNGTEPQEVTLATAVEGGSSGGEDGAEILPSLSLPFPSTIQNEGETIPTDTNRHGE